MRTAVLRVITSRYSASVISALSLSQIAFLEDLMAQPGYLDGRRMAGAFQLINSKDLVWSKLLHEYLMGAQTPMTAMRA